MNKQLLADIIMFSPVFFAGAFVVIMHIIEDISEERWARKHQQMIRDWVAGTLGKKETGE